MDDVIFAHAIWPLDVAAQPKRSAHAAFVLAVNGAHEYPFQADGQTGLFLAIRAY